MSGAYWTLSQPATIPASRPIPSGCWTRRANYERMERTLRTIITVAAEIRNNYGLPMSYIYERLTAIIGIAGDALAPETSPVAEDFDLPGQPLDEAAAYAHAAYCLRPVQDQAEPHRLQQVADRIVAAIEEGRM